MYDETVLMARRRWYEESNRSNRNHE
jgi:hypothetical protein